jgi:hypothetical protein
MSSKKKSLNVDAAHDNFLDKENLKRAETEIISLQRLLELRTNEVRLSLMGQRGQMHGSCCNPLRPVKHAATRS